MFITEDDLNLKNLTEVIYTIFRMRNRFPPFHNMISSQYMIDVLIYQGTVSPRVASFLKTVGERSPIFIYTVAKEINGICQMLYPRWCVSNELAAAYLSVNVIMGIPDLKVDYFTGEMVTIGAVGTPDNENPNDVKRHKIFDDSYIRISTREWNNLKAFYI